MGADLATGDHREAPQWKKGCLFTAGNQGGIKEVGRDTVGHGRGIMLVFCVFNGWKF